MKEFFGLIHQAMRDSERLRLEFTREGETLHLLLIPLLGDDSEKVPEAAQTVRAALATPLAMRGMTPDTLADTFAQRIGEFAGAHGSAASAYQSLLDTLTDATAEANAASHGERSEGW